MLATAVCLAECGIPVFPCLESKRPATPHGFKDAVDSPAAAEMLWRRFPGSLIGVPTGEVSGLDALDIDPRHGGDRWWYQHRALIDRTRVHSTRSGGLHVLFRHTDGVRNTVSTLATGVDTRGSGGFIIWWPGAGLQVVDEPIQPWPKWLLEKLLNPARVRSTLLPRAIYNVGGGGADRLAEAVLRRVRRAKDGEKHHTLRKAAYTIGGVLTHLSYGHAEAVRRLVTAAVEAGAVDVLNAERTAEWGLECGKAKPLDLDRSRDDE